MNTLQLVAPPLAVALDDTLKDTLARVGALADTFAGSIGPLEEEWFLAADLLAPASPALAEGLERAAVHYPGIDPRTSAAFFIGEYAWYVMAAAIAAYLAEGRAPSLAPENMALRYRTYTWRDGEYSGEAERVDVRFLSERGAALPGDPAALDPGVTLVPDRAALLQWLHDEVAAHLAPLIDRIQERTRFSKRAQWFLAADSCAALFLHAGQTLEDEARGQAVGLAFVNLPGSPMQNPRTGFVTLECAGHAETFRTRGGCCRFHTLPNGHKCSVCPLRPDAERDQLLLDYLARKHATEAAA